MAIVFEISHAGATRRDVERNLRLEWAVFVIPHSTLVHQSRRAALEEEAHHVYDDVHHSERLHFRLV